MSKLASFALLVCVMLALVVACGGPEPTSVATPTLTSVPLPTAAPVPPDTPPPVPAPTSTATPTPTNTPVPTPTSAPTPTTALTTDRDILIALYNSTDGPNWKFKGDWLSDLPISEWMGVTTDNNGRVIELSLYRNQLSGEIPPELGDLRFLEFLELNVNQLSGEMPPELGRLYNLVALDLSENQLSGEIPPELGQLSNLGGGGLASMTTG